MSEKEPSSLESPGQEKAGPVRPSEDLESPTPATKESSPKGLAISSDAADEAVDWVTFAKYYLPELAEVFGTEVQAHALLEDLGFPRSRLPGWSDTPTAFWREAARDIEFGVIDYGLEGLVLAAADRYPYNQVFARVYKSKASNDEAQEEHASSLLITGEFQVHELIDRARELAKELEIPGQVELGYSTPDMLQLRLLEASFEQAGALGNRLELEGIAPQATAISSQSRDYLLQRVFVEGPDHGRYELTDIPASTSPKDIVRAVMGEYYGETWPTDRSGRSRPAVIDRLEDDGSHRQLEPTSTLHESGIRDGDTLAVAPESTAGCFPRGTRVTLADGDSRAIDEIAVGDRVRIPGAGPSGFSRVTSVHRGKSNQLLRFNGRLATTPSQLLWANDRWTRAIELKPGALLSLQGGEAAELETVERIDGECDVFHIHLDSSDHAFFAEGVQVHNMSVKAAYGRDNLLDFRPPRHEREAPPLDSHLVRIIEQLQSSSDTLTARLDRIALALEKLAGLEPGARSSPSGKGRSAYLRLTVDGDLEDFDTGNVKRLAYYLATISETEESDIDPLFIAGGSVKVAFEVPEATARDLMSKFFDRDPMLMSILDSFAVTNVEIRPALPAGRLLPAAADQPGQQEPAPQPNHHRRLNYWIGLKRLQQEIPGRLRAELSILSNRLHLNLDDECFGLNESARSERARIIHELDDLIGRADLTGTFLERC